MVCRNVYEALHSTTNFLIIMILIDGKKQSAELREELKVEVENLKQKYFRMISPIMI